jgi:hypothetical protein
MAGYRMASDAARDLGVSIATYLSHENGTRGLGRTAVQYAQFFNVDLGWLLTGHGQPRGLHDPFDGVYKQLDRIEKKLDDLERRLRSWTSGAWRNQGKSSFGLITVLGEPILRLCWSAWASRRA